MKDWLPRLVILGLLAIIVGVPFALRPESDAATVRVDDASRLIIVSPHNEQIRHEISIAYARSRSERGLSPVFLDWRAGGGTSDLRKQVLAQFEAEGRRALASSTEVGGIGYDLFFGGGEYDHNKLAGEIKLSDTFNGQERTVTFTPTVPAGLSEAELAEIFPEPRIAGERLLRDDRRWLGTALSSFGIVYNRDVLTMLGLPEPATWSDLTDPRYLGWLALADPGHSGSIAATYNAILMRSGWTDGWKLLRRVYANSRYFSASSSKVPVDVSAGEAAAGMCIDFYGRFQSQAIGQRVGYIDPARMTATTADPISLLHGAPHRDVAVDFIRWMLSKPGQRLWQLTLGHAQGPTQFELRRMPVRRDLFTPEEMAHFRDPIDPFTQIAAAMPPGQPDLFGTVAPISHAMAIDVHEDLRAAWRAIVNHPDHPRMSQMLAAFDAMPPQLTLTFPDSDMQANWPTFIADKAHPRHAETAAHLKAFVKSITDPWKDRDRALQDRLAMTQFFRDQYAQVLALARE